jgi:superfamily II DNA/RNA helicase
MYGQIRGLMRNPAFVIGTPGRLKDLEKQRKLSFGSFQTIVLDEVDRMLDMGFINDVKWIVAKLPEKRHALFFSATLPENTKDIMSHFLKNPVTISVKKTNTSANVDQDVIRLEGKPKIDVLHDLLAQEGFDKVLVFGRTKWGMEKLAKELDDRGFKVASIHGNKNQNQRQRAINDFKSDKVAILLATDIASRGLDIPNVTHVINYDLPETYEDYVHRIGRTGRADKTGKALSFV